MGVAAVAVDGASFLCGVSEHRAEAKGGRLKRAPGQVFDRPHLLVVVVTQSDVAIGSLLQQPPRQQRLSLHDARLQ